jgi:hypothetical protein
VKTPAALAGALLPLVLLAGLLVGIPRAAGGAEPTTGEIAGGMADGAPAGMHGELPAGIPREAAAPRDAAIPEPARPSAPGAPAARPDDLVDVLLDLRMGRLGRRLVPALARGEEALLPVTDFLELAEVRFSDEGSLVRAVRQPGNIPLSWRPDAERQEVVFHEGRIYVASRRLERDFDVRVALDWNELAATVLDPEHLPVGLRVAREARWSAFRPDARIPGVRAPAERSLGTSPYLAGGFVADWSLAANAARPAESASGSLALGAQLLGGSLQVSARSEGPLREGEAYVAASYHLARTRGRLLRQFRLGDGFASGPRPRTLAGVHLTNAPYVREAFFGYESFQGRLGPGWEVELRQFGQTVDLRRADEEGAFALDIPLQYGDNTLEVIGYGPHGEVVTMDRLLLLRTDRLPRGPLEWGVSAGACRAGTRCVAAANADLRYGLTRRWTARAGVEGVQRDTLPDLTLPYLELSGAPLRPVNVAVEWLAGSSTRGSLFFTPTPDLRLRMAATRFADDSTRALFHDPGRRATWEADLFVRPFASMRSFGLTAAAVREERDRLETSRGRVLASVQRPRFRLEGGGEFVETRPRTGGAPVAGGVAAATGLTEAGYPDSRHVGTGPTEAGYPDSRQVGTGHGGRRLAGAAPAGIPLAPEVLSTRELRPVASLSTWIPGLGSGIRAPWVRVEAEFRQDMTAERIRARLGRSLGRYGRIEVGTRWSRSFGTELTASLVAELSALRSVSQWFAPEDQRGEMVQYLQGSVLWDEAEGRLRAASLPNLERAGVSGLVFLDENGNGIRDPGEPGVPGVRVLVEGRAVVTDAEGRYTADHLLPWEATRISVHEPSIPNPTWLPGFGSLDVPLSPSSFRRVDLPLVRTGEVTGRVVQVESGSTPSETGVAGAEVLLIELGGSGRIHEATTFRDGTFYFMGIPPGGYELRLTPGILRGLGLEPDFPRRNLVVEPSGEVWGSGIVIRLVPERSW